MNHFKEIILLHPNLPPLPLHTWWNFATSLEQNISYWDIQ